MALLNYTPHRLSVRDRFNLGRVLLDIPSTGVARVTASKGPAGEVEHGGVRITVFTVTYGEVTGLPDAIGEDDWVVVSQLTAQAAKKAGHPLAPRLLVVDGVVRLHPDKGLNLEIGDIVGCTGLAEG